MSLGPCACFFAFPVGKAEADRLDGEVREIEGRATFRMRRVPAGSHHVTLCFVPGMQKEWCEEVWKVAADFPAAGPLKFQLGPVEGLMGRGLCRLLLRKVRFEVERARMAQSQIGRGMREAGAGAEFSISEHYHVTLARMAGFVRASAVRAFLEKERSETITGTFETLAMVRSELTPEGPGYETMFEKAL